MYIYFRIQIDEFYLGEVTRRMMPDSWCFLTPVLKGKEAYGIIFNDYFEIFIRLLNRKEQRTLEILEKKEIEALKSKHKMLFLYNLNGNLDMLPRRLTLNIPNIRLN